VSRLLWACRKRGISGGVWASEFRPVLTTDADVDGLHSGIVHDGRVGAPAGWADSLKVEISGHRRSLTRNEGWDRFSGFLARTRNGPPVEGGHKSFSRPRGQPLSQSQKPYTFPGDEPRHLLG
jgi:hypothetical protein